MLDTFEAVVRSAVSYDLSRLDELMNGNIIVKDDAYFFESLAPKGDKIPM